jgi:putative DNA primase/helicase
MQGRFKPEDFAEFIVADKPARGAPEKPRASFSSPDSIGSGQRNQTLVRIAASLRNKNLSQEALEAALLAENLAKCEPPLDEKEVLTIARWVEGKDGAGAEWRKCTDAGNAERFADAYQGRLLYCLEKQSWLEWTGAVWAAVDDVVAVGYAIDVARKIADEAKGVDNSEVAEGIRGWAQRSESAERIGALVRLAKSLPRLRVSVAKLDADPWILNVENGALDLRTGNLLPHNPALLCSKLAPVRFVAGAQSPILDAYLDQVTGKDAAFVGFIQRALGYSLTGDTGAEVLFLLLGPGGSGKSTLVEGFRQLMGGYAAVADSRTLLSSKNENTGPRTDIARLHGSRMVIASEMDKGKALASGIVKSLTGRDTITCRRLYESEIEFLPTMKFWLAANDAPAIADDDSGLWRRVLRLPFMRTIPKDAQDPAVKAAILEDPGVRSALLSFAVQGCLDWQSRGKGRKGLAVPEIVTKATTDYQADSSPIVDFIDECCELGESFTCGIWELRDAYAQWVKRAGNGKGLSLRELNKRFEEIKCTRTTKWANGKAVKMWSGVKLTEVQSSKEDIEKF